MGRINEEEMEIENNLLRNDGKETGEARKA